MTLQELKDKFNKLNLSNTPIFEWLKVLPHKLDDTIINEEIRYLGDNSGFLGDDNGFIIKFELDKEGEIFGCNFSTSINQIRANIFISKSIIDIKIFDLFQIKLCFNDDNNIHIIIIKDIINDKVNKFYIQSKYDHKVDENTEWIKSIFDVFLYLCAFDFSPMIINALALSINICKDIDGVKEFYEEFSILGLDKSNKEILDEIIDISNIPTVMEYKCYLEYKQLYNEMVNNMFKQEDFF